jgi:hypothetical protein
MNTDKVVLSTTQEFLHALIAFYNLPKDNMSINRTNMFNNLRAPWQTGKPDHANIFWRNCCEC